MGKFMFLSFFIIIFISLIFITYFYLFLFFLWAKFCVSLLFAFRFQSMFGSNCNQFESWLMPCIICIAGCIFFGIYWTCLVARHPFDEMIELSRNELVCDMLEVEFVMLDPLVFLFTSEVI